MNIEELSGLLSPYEKEVCEMADKIWGYAETCFEEHRSSRLLMECLQNHDFVPSQPDLELPTAFTARFGEGHPVIGLLGEYDALPGLSQKADSTIQEAESAQPDLNGHGCGHNLLGCGALGAALMLKDYLNKSGRDGTVIYYGCPAEENMAGKAKMLEKHYFSDADICFSWHPGCKTSILNDTLANFRVSYRFHGTTAHAAQAPHMGRSALDACELMNIGVNYLREHMIDEARIHYAYLNAGGTAPNIIPAEAEVFYAIRAPKNKQAADLKERVNDVARGAALMTGTTLEIQEKSAYDSFRSNTLLDKLVLKYLERFTPLNYTEEEFSYARQYVLLGNKPNAPCPIDGVPDMSSSVKSGFSTDVGNVSQVIPTAAFLMTCYADGSHLHHWTVTSQGKSSLAHKGMLAASKVLAACGIELFENPKLAEQAREELLVSSGLISAAAYDV